MGNTSNLFLQSLSHVPLAQQQLMKFENIHANNVSMELFFSFEMSSFFFYNQAVGQIVNFQSCSLFIRFYPVAMGKSLTFFSSFAETGLAWRTPSYGTADLSGDRVSASLEN